jgi:16S rRNA (cytosine967-C5)-methyltransferase
MIERGARTFRAAANKHPKFLVTTPTPKPSARQAAFHVLLAVEQEGEQAAPLLDAATAGLDPRDAGLATQIVFGVLRRRAQVDQYVAVAARRPLEKVDPAVLTILRMGAFQLRFLDKIPPHAAVDESVRMTRRAGKASAAGFVNAVLRHLPEASEAWPSDVIRYSMPGWLWRRWVANLGPELAATAGEASLTEPEAYWREGRRMDVGAQSIVPLLELQEGHRFLDLCAAPGNKLLHALETPIRAVACDASPSRLRALLADCPRVRLDGTCWLPFGPVFDRILVDAPCSGTGTLARNPEIRWRLTQQEIMRQANRQVLLVQNALAALKPGGRLVYSTCSLEPEENEQVLERAAAGRVLKTVMRVPGRDPGDGFFAAVVE